MRSDIVAFVGRRVRNDHAPQRIGLEVVLPDAPVRRVLELLVRVELHAQRKYGLLAVIGNVEVADVAQAVGDGARDVLLGRSRVCARTHIDVAARKFRQEFARIRVHGGHRDLPGEVRHRPLDVEEREVERDRIRVLATNATPTLPSPSAAASRERPRPPASTIAAATAGSADRTFQTFRSIHELMDVPLRGPARLHNVAIHSAVAMRRNVGCPRQIMALMIDIGGSSLPLT